MRLLLDTNVILRLANEDDAEHSLVREAVERTIARVDKPVLVPQCVYEFWSTCTRPVRVNGFGWESARTRSEVERLLSIFPLLPDVPEVFSRWLELVMTYRVSGKQAHDARLVASLKAHGVEGLLTLNGDDFRRFDINVVHPRDVLG